MCYPCIFSLSCESILGDLFHRIAMGVILTSSEAFPKKGTARNHLLLRCLSCKFVTLPSKKLAQTNCDLTSRRGFVPSDGFPACQNLTESLFGSSAREGWLEDEVSPLSPPPVSEGPSSCQGDGETGSRQHPPLIVLDMAVCWVWLSTVVCCTQTSDLTAVLCLSFAGI